MEYRVERMAEFGAEQWRMPRDRHARELLPLMDT